MKITSDINILGSIPDFGLVDFYFKSLNLVDSEKELIKDYHRIRTEKSTRRFGKAIISTLLTFQNERLKNLIVPVLLNEGISPHSLWLLFWNSSINNELFNHLNETVFFPAFYSGRLVLRKEEVSSKLKDLKQVEKDLQKWSDSTINVTASKYLTLLKKFNLLEGKASKTIKHPYLEDSEFILFIYFILATEKKSNLLESSWIKYSLIETRYFVERVLHKRYAKYFDINYSADKLRITPLIEYEKIYYVITQSQPDLSKDKKTN